MNTTTAARWAADEIAPTLTIAWHNYVAARDAEDVYWRNPQSDDQLTDLELFDTVANARKALVAALAEHGIARREAEALLP